MSSGIVFHLLAALAYALLAGFEVPAQRTLCMLSVVALALWSGRNFGVSRTLLLALLVGLLGSTAMVWMPQRKVTMPPSCV